MKTFFKKILLLCLLFLSSFGAKAQYITIPDPNFVNWLNTHGYSGCMNGNQLDSTCSAVLSTTFLNCSSSNISDLTGISVFDSLQDLRCGNSPLAILPDLPANLEYLVVNVCNLQVLPSLPPGLLHLECIDNQLTSLPSLPPTLVFLACAENLLTALPPLPSGLIELNCSDNNLAELSVLPDSLKMLYAYSCQWDSVPPLNTPLLHLFLSDNLLHTLPALPGTLTHLWVDFNPLDSLPEIPSSMFSFGCNDAGLKFLPILPDTLYELVISGNPDLHCLPPVYVEYNFEWSNTGINCFPNALNPFSSTPSVSGIPICDVFNTYNCQVDWNIRGNVFRDSIMNCIADIQELRYPNVKLKLYDSGFLYQQMLTSTLGEYAFTVPPSTYTYEIDTTDQPYTVDCPVGFLYTSTISAATPISDNMDFSIQCKPGFDVVVESVINTTGIFFPGTSTHMSVRAGDLSRKYNLNCAAGQSGTIVVVKSGPAAFDLNSFGSLIPAVNGDTLTYTIADFGQHNLAGTIDFNVITDTLAQLNQQVCFDVSILNVSGDNIPANNFYTHCNTVVNSFDPNDKQVSPIGLIDSSEYWLTYTVRFQNTGTAPAHNIYIMDTLDQNIDESSFQLLAYSHEPLVQIVGNVIRFNYPGIYLPDSVNNEPASHGYIQYKVKRNFGLPIGTQIHNTAYIYFDFNAPVVTNTTVNEITQPVSTGIADVYKPSFYIYPNPISSGHMLNVRLNENQSGVINLYEVGGRKLESFDTKASQTSFQIDLPNLSPGIYLCEFLSGSSRSIKKLVITE